MEALLEVLKKSKASEFLIRRTNTVSQEAFFIGQKLDMGRAKDVTHTMVTVYVDSEDKKFRGSATKEIHPGSSVEQMEKEINEAIFAASFVKNPWFPLVENQTGSDNGIDVDLTEQLVKITKAMQNVSARANEKVNSYEIFVNKHTKRILNSKGVDVTMSNFDCEIEVVINAEKDGHEIELLKDMKFENKNAEEITKEVESLLKSGQDRLQAVPTKQNEHATVLLTGDDVKTFFEYFTNHANVSYQYMGYAKVKQGEKFTGDEADDLSLVALPILEGSTKNATHDNDGKLVKECTLYENGVCKSYWGTTQHAYYLGAEDVTNVNNVVVSGGSMSYEDMKKQPHLEITDFSAFLMDAISGNFGGEIRLAYESDGASVRPVVGGSLSANYERVLKNMKFSQETRQLNNWVVPKAVMLTDVIVAGEA